MVLFRRRDVGGEETMLEGKERGPPREAFQRVPVLQMMVHKLPSSVRAWGTKAEIVQCQ